MRKETLIWFGIAVASLLASTGAYAYWFFAFEGARAEARAAMGEVARIEREDAEIRAAEGALATLTADESAVRAYFLAPEDIVAFLETLQASGGAFGTAIEVVSVAPATDGRIGLSLHIDGSFEGVMRTLGALEFGPRDIRIASLTLDTPPNEATGEWGAAATFTVGALASSTEP